MGLARHLDCADLALLPDVGKLIVIDFNPLGRLDRLQGTVVLEVALASHLASLGVSQQNLLEHEELSVCFDLEWLVDCFFVLHH